MALSTSYTVYVTSQNTIFFVIRMTHIPRTQFLP